MLDIRGENMKRPILLMIQGHAYTIHGIWRASWLWKFSEVRIVLNRLLTQNLIYVDIDGRYFLAKRGEACANQSF